MSPWLLNPDTLSSPKTGASSNTTAPFQARADGKGQYGDQLRLHVQPPFEPFTLGEITTGRVEWS